MLENLLPFIQLGGTVVTVILFLYYLIHRDREERSAREALAKDMLERVDKIVSNCKIITDNYAKSMDNTNGQVKEIIDDLMELAKDSIKNRHGPDQKKRGLPQV